MCSNIEGSIFQCVPSGSHFFIGGDFMSIYKKMYYHLFNCVTDALEEADIDKVKEILKNAQIETEEIYISSDE